MGRKALIAVLCWITLCTSAKSEQSAHGDGLIDNISEESAPQLYRNAPVKVYASSAPYAAFSFNVPQLAAQNADKVVPLNKERMLAQSTNSYLRDSYGQRFVDTPEDYAYKAAIPQQFVPLQTLPAHLSQPLLAAAPSGQYGQGTHFFEPSAFRLGNLQAFPDHLNPFGHSQPFIYAENVRTVAATPVLKPQANNGKSAALQQSTNNKKIYASNFIDHYNNIREQQRIKIQQDPKISANNIKQQHIVKSLPLVHVPKETTITSITNGKKTVVNLITKPTLPLLDLTLLEPLTFDNPLVPQVQHFLPKIHRVIYKTLPELNQAKNQQKVYTVQNTKSYNSGVVKRKPKTKKKKHRKTTKKTKHVEVIKKPVVTVHELHNETPEISYEINSPNYKETYSEKKVSYNKETQSEPVHISYEKKTAMKPVHYSYEKHTENEPVHYNYVHVSNEPAQLKQAQHEEIKENPKHLIYHFKPDEAADEEIETEDTAEADEDALDESSNESETEEQQRQEDEYQQSQQKPQQQQQSHNKPQHELAEEEVEITYIQPHHNEEISYHKDREELLPVRKQNIYFERLKEDPESKREEVIYYHNPNKEASVKRSESLKSNDYKNSEEPKKQFEKIVPEYEELKKNKAKKPESSENIEVNNKNNSYKNKQNSNTKPQKEQVHHDYPKTKTYYSSSPVIEEKSKHIIIKQESPQDIFEDSGELMAAMVKKQQKSEEDFEKAYKDAAYGFLAYDSSTKDAEKEIYNPESYGVSRYTSDFDVIKSPLRQYVANGDTYPTHTRLQYKDARDKTNDDYFSGYSASRHESLIDQPKKKADYYQNYMEHLPKKEFFEANDADDKKSAKYVAAPVYNYQSSQQNGNSAKLQEYDYAKEAPHDSSAFASRPFKAHSGNIQYLQSPFQYGFNPLRVSRSLTTMADSDSPEGEKTEARKKIYKENLYIKRSGSATGSQAAS